MRPEEAFKIEDSEIPENKEELVDSSENEITDKKIDIFSKELTIEDLMEFLKKNNISNDFKTIEKYYNEIITNNNEKESIVQNIKELDSQKEILIKQIENEPNNPILLKKINDLDEKISNLNTEERIKEDNVKITIREMSKIEPEKIKISENSKIEKENIPESKITEIEKENIPESKITEIEKENILESKIAEINKEPVQQNTENISKINDTAFEGVKNVEENKKNENFFENINLVEPKEDGDVLKNMERDHTLEEIRKNSKFLDEMSKNINSNFQLVLETIKENLGKMKEEGNAPQVKEIEPSHVENPDVTQPDYISAYRRSLREYSGIEPFIGIETKLKADNMGSYI